MCTILTKDHLIGKNYDSTSDGGMLFTNKRGLIKKAAVFPPNRPLEWVSSYGSITFSQSGKEMPVGGVNEAGLVVEQTTLLSAVYPEQEGRPAASSLEVTQFLLDTCSNVEHALAALEQIAITKASWPVHFALFDRSGRTAVVEYLNGEMIVYNETAEKAVLLTNTEYRVEEIEGDLLSFLEEARRPDTVWSNIYDLRERKLLLKRPADTEAVVIELDRIDFSPGGRNQMLNIKEGDAGFKPYTEEANRLLISGFFHHPVTSRLMKLTDPEAMVDFIAEQSKIYDRTNEIVLRFLEGEKIKQIPVKYAHKIYVLKYLASKFEVGKEYSEGQVNAVVYEWHTFGDYFVLRRELIDSGLMKRLPDGSKYWRELL